MTNSLTTVLGKVQDGIGQGGVFDQVDKIYRKQQRINLFEKLETINDQDIKDFPVGLYKSIIPNGKKQPSLLRFYLPSWKNQNEIFWQSLGDYAILAIHRVIDIEYDSGRGRMKMTYFPKVKGRIKNPEEIRRIIQKIAYLVDTEGLPTDFTRFRRMTERRDSLGEMSKEQAALIGAALKLIQIP